MRCAADLHLGSHVDSTDRAGENYSVHCIITPVYPAAGVGADRLDGHALILGIDDMFSLRYTTD